MDRETAIRSSEQRYLSTAEAAAYLGLSPGTLENMRTEGRGPRYFRLVRQCRYCRDDLEAWMRAHAQGGEQPAEDVAAVAAG
jgi:excisionase family DNA binding protein